MPPSNRRQQLKRARCIQRGKQEERKRVKMLNQYDDLSDEQWISEEHIDEEVSYLDLLMNSRSAQFIEEQLSENRHKWRPRLTNSNVRNCGTSRATCYRNESKKKALALSAKGTNLITSYYRKDADANSNSSDDEIDSMNCNFDVDDECFDDEKLATCLSYEDAYDKLTRIVQKHRIQSLQKLFQK